MTNLLEQYYTTRESRLNLQREADKLEQVEKDILYEITKFWDPIKTVAILEGGYKLKGKPKPFPFVTDWAQTLDYIRERPASIDLLQKRLTESAVKARWDSGITIPGVEKRSKWAVTISKE